MIPDYDTIAQTMADTAPDEPDWEQHYIDAHSDDLDDLGREDNQ